jgi:hypothetical protein
VSLDLRDIDLSSPEGLDEEQVDAYIGSDIEIDRCHIVQGLAQFTAFSGEHPESARPTGR